MKFSPALLPSTSPSPEKIDNFIEKWGFVDFLKNMFCDEVKKRLDMDNPDPRMRFKDIIAVGYKGNPYRDQNIANHVRGSSGISSLVSCEKEIGIVIDMVFGRLFYHSKFSNEKTIMDMFSFKHIYKGQAWELAHFIAQEEARVGDFLEGPVSIKKDIEILKKLCQQESIVRGELLHSDQEMLRNIDPARQTPDQMYELLKSTNLFTTEEQKEETINRIRDSDVRKYGNHMGLLWADPTEKNLKKVLEAISSEGYSNEDSFKEFFIQIYWKAKLCKIINKKSKKSRIITSLDHKYDENQKNIFNCFSPAAVACGCIGAAVFGTIFSLQTALQGNDTPAHDNDDIPAHEISVPEKASSNNDGNNTIIWDDALQQGKGNSVDDGNKDDKKNKNDKDDTEDNEKAE